MTKALLFAFAVLSTGCMTASHYAIYKHPATGDVLECEKAAAKGGADIYGLGDAPTIAKYNTCKDNVEGRGYQRVGTVDREPSGLDLSVPQPGR
jgi:hypothetical protein